MTDDPDRDKLDELSARIAKAQNASKPLRDQEEGGRSERFRAFARAMRIGTDFVSTVLAGIGLGWFLDEQMGTAPWGLIGLFSGGVVVAFWSLIRSVGVMAQTKKDQRRNRG